MPYDPIPPAEDPRPGDVDEREMLLRDAERLIGGLEAITDVIVTVDMQRESPRDE